MLNKTVNGNERNLARERAKEAYEEMAAHVFEPDELEKAVIKLEEARNINPKESFVYVADSYWTLVKGYTIGDWYDAKTFAKRTLEQSLVLAEKAIELDSYLPEAYAQVSRILIIKGDFPRAQVMLDKMRTLDPENFYYWYYQAISYENQHEPEKAAHFLDEAEKRSTQDYHHYVINLHRQNVAALGNDLQKEEQLLKDNIKNNPTSFSRLW